MRKIFEKDGNRIIVDYHAVTEGVFEGYTDLGVDVPFCEDYQRNVRDGLLQKTDWCGLSDHTMTDEQTAYRQALRDITTHTNWPDLADSDWPTKPE